MTSKVRTLLFLLMACAVLLIIDYFVYLSPHLSSSRRGSEGYSVRRGSKDHGSRWGYDNTAGGQQQGTMAVPINRSNSSQHDGALHAANHSHPYNPPPIPHPIIDSVPSNDSAQLVNLNTHDSNHPINSSSNANLNKAAVNENPLPQSGKNSSKDHLPPSGNVLESESKKPAPVKTQLAPGSIKNVQTKEKGADKNGPQTRTEYLNPNKSCSVGKSRQRMLNSFGLKFNSSLPAFIDSTFTDIPNISKYPPPFGFANSVPAVSELLKHLPETGLPKDLQKKSCLRCIVVGNGGILKRSALGSVIDNFDVIIRMNDAPTRGFEHDVGGKTTIRIFYPESAPKKDRDYDGKPWLFLMMAFKTSDLKWLQSMAKGDKLTSLKEFWKKPATKIPKKASEFRLLNAAIVKETAFDIIGLNPNNGKMKANVPTTGSISIMLGLRLCDEVSIAGFGYDLSAPKAPMHYYDNLKMSDMKKSWTHDINLEKNMLLQLVRQGVITDLTGGIR